MGGQALAAEVGTLARLGRMPQPQIGVFLSGLVGGSFQVTIAYLDLLLYSGVLDRALHGCPKATFLWMFVTILISLGLSPGHGCATTTIAARTEQIYYGDGQALKCLNISCQGSGNTWDANLPWAPPSER